MRLSRSIVGREEASAVARVICEDGYLGMGAETREFEARLAEYLGVEPWQIVSCNSGTAALHLAVWAASAHPLRRIPESAAMPEILVPTLTFVSSFQAILAGGCKPVACDVLPETGTLDLEDAARRLTGNTIAVMHVDYASNPWHLDAVYAFGASNGLRVIDDAAHAFGCRHHGRKVGSFGDLVCFSFDGIKNITCGEGGCLVAFDRESASIAADARLLGVEGDTARRFAGGRSWQPKVERPGLRYHLSNIMAAIGNVQLSRLEDEFIPARRELYNAYVRLLRPERGLKLLETDPEDYIVPHIMPVRILDGKKEKVIERLAAAGIPTGIHYKPNHLHPLFGNGREKLANAERLYAELVTLPLHPGLDESDVQLVCSALDEALA
ncbi:MAG: DegT/DnrJ/EryC1/StrS family aminotransferase [Desulfovibrio sp.]|nr:DegT/DnrJ/EryC1/StrS family aminotransferase [Desulfovibrio sp.]